MTTLEMYDKDAKHLLDRICKAISLKYDYVVKPVCCVDGSAYITSQDAEVAWLSGPDVKSKMFFISTKDLVQSLLMPKTVICFHPYGKDAISFNVNEMLGSTLEEVQINLDLLHI